MVKFPSSHMRKYRFYNCRALVNDELIQRDIYVADGKIVEACENSDYTAIDCEGKILAPGFIDIQLNGGFGADFSECKDVCAAVDHVAQRLPSTGCTGFNPTIITSAPATYHNNLPRLKIKGQHSGAINLGVHLEGPLICMSKRGCHPEQHVKCAPDFKHESEVAEYVASVYGSDLSGVSIITIAPEQAGGCDIIRYLAKQGILLNLGHSSAYYDEGCRGIESGASALTHLFCAMTGIDAVKPGLAQVIINKHLRVSHSRRLHNVLQNVDSGSHSIDSQIYYGLIADNIHLSDSALQWALKVNPSGLCLITDGISALGLGPGEFKLGDTTVTVDGSPLRAVKKGTDTLAGVVEPMNRCIRNFMRSTDCGIEFALNAASRTPARYLGIDGFKGRLEPGFDADIVIIDDEINICATYVNGDLVFSA